MTDSGRLESSTRIECFLVLSALFVGGGLRAWRFTELGLSHFDEGIYSLAGLWPWTGIFPTDQAFYSPPAFPLLVGLAGLLWGGPTELAGPSVSCLIGTASIGLAWQAGRRSFGVGGGVLAAWLVAMDGFQIGLSRIGLTDGVFEFEFLLSLLLIDSALREGGWKVAMAGLAVGFTWNTKYNGFLPLVLAMGWIPGEIWKIKTTRWLYITLISLIIYLPWATWFHVKHGYGALVAHQRGYLAGPSGLLDGWRRGLLGFEAMGSLPILILITAVFGIVLSVRSNRWARVWISGWLLVLPALYTPYLRLWAPTELWLLVLAGGGLAAGWNLLQPSLGPVGAALLVGGLTAGAGWLELATMPVSRRVYGPASTAGYREAGPRLADWSRDHQRTPSGVVRPPLLFYLAERGIPFVRLADSSISKAMPADQSLVFDRALADSPRAQADWKAKESTYREVARFPVQPSMLTLLDDSPADRLPQDLSSYDVRVYEAAGR